ncbi:MAG: LysM peptidoglycan-binding domain-containing M23 family metallopeptidase [Synergistaceae bacterium]|nr:LysM peptidoglycan-binding domain-containing M23 family metallopeptidase [Synergistaceae bacterium]
MLIISADSRFSEAAWGYLKEESDTESISLDGFMVVDLSEAGELDTERTASEAVSMQGAAFAAQVLADSDVNVSKGERTTGDASSPATEGETEFPSESDLTFLQLSSFLREPLGAFGPMPKDFADFESIILNTADDGARLPEDSDSSDEGVAFADVGVSWKEHVVKSGETLSDIALQYGGLTAQDILRANGLKDANRLSTQQILLIPNSSDFIEDTLEEVRTRQARVAALREQATPLKIASYVVAQGDSLWSIASAQNLEVDTLVGSNVFKNSILQPGMVLRIPNQDGIFYTFKNKDKIEAVAKRYKVSLDKIRKVSPTIDLVSLKPGNEIFLPGARPEAIAETPPAKGKTEKASAANASGGTSRSYRWPVMGKINSPFGWRRHPITRRQDFHTGLDIKAAAGTVIRSSRSGRVAYAGWMAGYGKVVVVEHGDGQSTLYAHCSSLLVRQKDKVSVGQNIARVGSTGRTTGPHLHFEVRNGNSPVNPLKYLR